MNKKYLKLFFLILFAFSNCVGTHTLRYPPSRWLDDLDQTPVKKPDSRDPTKAWDFINYQFIYQFERLTDFPERIQNFPRVFGVHTKQEAYNINNFDEVADSTWFTNRIGRFKMTSAQISTGPNQSQGPNPKGPWTILSAKSEGLTPGFLIEDAKGNKYLFKFDPLRHPEMATGAELISTKFLHAVGFNVPENYLVSFDPKILQISPKAMKPRKTTQKVPFTQKDLQELLNKIPLTPDGKYRALASKFLPGKALGPFNFNGRDHSDPNDRIDHQFRRELRGYRVFSALLNHTDSRAANTLNMFMAPEGSQKGYVKHNLIDFGGTIGSASVHPKRKNHMYDYRLDPIKVVASLVTLGIYKPYWEEAQSPDLPGLGFFEAKLFEPQKWRPSYPNPAFQNMTDRDGFWAAKILMKFTDQDIAAIVKEACYSDTRTQQYITKTLIERRNKIGRHWFKVLNPLDDFALVSNKKQIEIKFNDLAVESGLESAANTKYRYLLHAGNEASWQTSEEPKITLPISEFDSKKFNQKYELELQTQRTDQKSWSPSVVLVLKNDPQFKLWGLERHY